MNDITRPVTDDGLAGYDAKGNFCLKLLDKSGESVSITFKYVADVRDMTCPICNHGWSTKSSYDLDDQMKWHAMSAYVHETCMVRYLALQDRTLFVNALVDAKLRFEVDSIKTMPSKYWGPHGRWSERKWCSIELLDHPIRVVFGKRKKVYSITFEAMSVSELPWWEKAKQVFSEFDVTKEFGAKSILLHAWGDTQAKLFISTLAEVGRLHM